MIDFAEFMAVIASTLDSVDETAELQQAFNVCDADRDGYLSHEDILRVRIHWCSTISPRSTRNTEVGALIGFYPLLPTQTAHSPCISNLSSGTQMSNLMNLGLTEDDVMEIIKESDRDRDFHISVEEFTKLMRGDGV